MHLYKHFEQVAAHPCWIKATNFNQNTFWEHSPLTNSSSIKESPAKVTITVTYEELVKLWKQWLAIGSSKSNDVDDDRKATTRGGKRVKRWRRREKKPNDKEVKKTDVENDVKTTLKNGVETTF